MNDIAEPYLDDEVLEHLPGEKRRYVYAWVPGEDIAAFEATHVSTSFIPKEKLLLMAVRHGYKVRCSGSCTPESPCRLYYLGHSAPCNSVVRDIVPWYALPILLEERWVSPVIEPGEWTRIIIPDCAALVNAIKQHSLYESTIHGEDHWLKVAAAGLELAKQTSGAVPALVLLFALFHDSQRQDDGHDPDHGARGADLARRLHGEGFFFLTNAELELLCRACRFHAEGFTTPDPTTGVCWDADRLNLWRVGRAPREALLCTSAARRPERIAWARELQSETFCWEYLYNAFCAVEEGDIEAI